ncbi:hypothetical protein GCM10009836_12330 [Pseudonocardia ailaonensis]|uniref:Uncharacterized protein n=1 Tax=Pseudonocardia ailaonensis TaxID=367279 RepID=A0ABN2MQV8_9PSEU
MGKDADDGEEKGEDRDADMIVSGRGARWTAGGGGRHRQSAAPVRQKSTWRLFDQAPKPGTRGEASTMFSHRIPAEAPCSGLRVAAASQSRVSRPLRMESPALNPERNDPVKNMNAQVPRGGRTRSERAKVRTPSPAAQPLPPRAGRSGSSIGSDQFRELDGPCPGCHYLCMPAVHPFALVTLSGDLRLRVLSAGLTRRLAIDLGRTTAAACPRPCR